MFSCERCFRCVWCHWYSSWCCRHITFTWKCFSDGVSQTSTLTLAFINFFIPFLLIFIIDGFKGIKETLPSILVVSITYTALQALLTVFNGPELADIIPPLASMLALALFSKKFQPKNIFRIQKMSNQNPFNIIKVKIYYTHGVHSSY